MHFLPTVSESIFNTKVRPECGAASTWLSQQHYELHAKYSIQITGSETLHFCPYIERASSTSPSSCASKASTTTCYFYYFFLYIFSCLVCCVSVICNCITLLRQLWCIFQLLACNVVLISQHTSL